MIDLTKTLVVSKREVKESLISVFRVRRGWRASISIKWANGRNGGLCCHARLKRDLTDAIISEIKNRCKSADYIRSVQQLPPAYGKALAFTL